MSTVVPVLILCLSSFDGLEPRAETSAGSGFVGEPIEVAVSVVADDERPRLTLPKPVGATLTPLGEEFRRVSASGIGDVLSVKNLFVWRFRVVGTRVGKAELPPFRLSLGERTGATARLSWNIKPPPPGRPSGFLGGVGRLKIRAEVDPPAAKLGSDVEYRLVLEGPGAVGSVERPDLSRIEALPIRARLTPLADDLKDEPPVRTLRYRLRAESAGAVRLPAITAAWLEPKSQRWQSSVSNAVELTIIDVPRFDPSTLPTPVLDTSAASPDEGRRRSPFGWWGGGGISTAILLLAAGRAKSRRGIRKGVDRLIARVSTAPPEDLPATVSAAIHDLLTLFGRAHEGELGPNEIEAEALRLGLPAASLRELAAACEAARFGRSVADPENLRRGAVAMLEGCRSLSRVHRNQPFTAS